MRPSLTKMKKGRACYGISCDWSQCSLSHATSKFWYSTIFSHLLGNLISFVAIVLKKML